MIPSDTVKHSEEDSEDTIPQEQFYSLLFVLCSIFVIIVMGNAYYVCDDAMISFAIAENFVNGYGLTYNVLERVQVQTNPFWTLLMGLLRIVTGEYHFTSMFLSLCLIGGIFALSRSFYSKTISSILLVVSFISSKAFMTFSGSGLEVPLSMFCVFVTVFMVYKSPPKRQVFWVTLCGSLAVFNRFDLAVVVFPLSVACLIKNDSIPIKERAIQFLLGGIPIMLWLGIAVFYYGHIFPNTYYAKVGGLTIDTWERVQSGLGYFRAALNRDQFSLLVIGLSFYLLWKDKKKTWREWTLGLSLLLSTLYVLKTGGDHMFPRALVVPTFVALLISLKQLEEKNYVGHRWSLDASVLIFFVFMGFSTPYSPLRILALGEKIVHPPEDTKLDKINNHNIRDFQLFWWSARLNGFNTRGRPKAGSRTEEVFSSQGAAGKVSFYYGPGMHNIDPMSLADPVMSRLPQQKKVFMPDHNIRSYPLGYVESVIAKQNLIVDPSLHEFYDKVLLITRGPLVSWDRFVAIVKMNVGGYQHLIDGYNGRGAIKDLSEYIDEKHPVEGYDLVYCPDKFQQFELLCLDKD